MQVPQDLHNKRSPGSNPRTIPAPGSHGTLPEPPALAGIQEVGDPAQWESVSPPWVLLARPTGKGRFHNREHFVVTPNCVLYAESFGVGFCVSGLTPAGMLGVTLPLYLGEASSYWGLRAALEKGVPACLPGVLDASIASGQRHLDSPAGLRVTGSAAWRRDRRRPQSRSRPPAPADDSGGACLFGLSPFGDYR
jgi:hypothetical protein